MQPQSWHVFVPSRGTTEAVDRVHRQFAVRLPPGSVTIVLNPAERGDVYPGILDRCRSLGMTPAVCVGGGAARARNTALALASTDVVVFLDDDVTATEDAVRRLIAGLRRTGACVATGRVLAAPTGHRSDDLWRTDLTFDRGAESAIWAVYDSTPVSPCQVWQFGVGAAFAVDIARMRQLIDSVVSFDERLSNGRFAGGAEDVDYFYSVYVAGGTIAYVADAVFRHDFPSALGGVRAKCRQYAIADGAFYAKWRSRANVSDVVGEARGWCARVARHVRARAKREPTVPLRSLLAEPAYKAVGALTWQVRCRSSC